MIIFSRKTHGFVGFTHHFRVHPHDLATLDNFLGMASAIGDLQRPQEWPFLGNHPESFEISDRSKPTTTVTWTMKSCFVHRGSLYIISHGHPYFTGYDFIPYIYSNFMGVSKNSGTPKSSILIGFSIINHPFWGTPIFGNIIITQPTKPQHLLCCRAGCPPAGTFLPNLPAGKKPAAETKHKSRSGKKGPNEPWKKPGLTFHYTDYTGCSWWSWWYKWATKKTGPYFPLNPGWLMTGSL